MPKLTISQKTNFAILTSFSLIAVIGICLYVNTLNFIKTEAWVKHTNQVTANVMRLVGALVNMETGVRGFAVGGEAKFLEPFTFGKADFDKVMDETRALVSDNPAQVGRLNKLAEAESTWIKTDVDPTIALRREAGTDPAKLAEFITNVNLAKGKAQMDGMRALAAEITGIEEDLLVIREADFQKAADSSKRLISIGLPLAMILGLVLLIWVIRGAVRSITQIASTLNAGAEEFTSSATQVSSSSQTLAQGASEQAASLEETSASLEEMSSMTSRNTGDAEKVNQLAREARTAADSGVTDMQAMITAMNDIRSSSQEIAKIIKSIDEIAFQTNILALNAAVEAARAGEAGAGFAVVADEVRNLAQRAAMSARETSGKIESALSKTAHGALLTEKVAHSLQEIVSKVRQVDELADQVATSSKEQTQGVQQLNDTVRQMDKVTQDNAATAEETSSASEQLNAQAKTLKETVSALLLLVVKPKQA